MTTTYSTDREIQFFFFDFPNINFSAYNHSTQMNTTMIPENTESTMSGESHKNKIYKKKKRNLLL